MTGCESYYVVAFYGSYLKDNYLWIVMEYCAAGSVSDIMNLCHKTLDEGQIAVVCKYVLHGLAYLHSKRKIHRDIKAGNILINDGGEAKLADFGVAGQLTDNMSKRNTVIGTPFWMAPEVIQEVGYGVSADIWSLGITCIEMADGRPPYHNIHPMRAIFMIPTKPPPKLEDETKFSAPFRNFIARCLTKDPKERPTAETLMAEFNVVPQDPFITSAPGLDAVGDIVKETLEAIAKGGLEDRKEDDDDDDETSGGSDGRDEAAARALRGEAPVARPRERGARPVSRQNARRRSKTPGGGRSDDDGDMTIKLGKGEAPAASRGGAATDSSGAVSPTSPPGGRGLEPGRSDGEDDGGTITMGMAGRLAGAWSVSQVAGSRDSGTIVLGRGLQASSSSGSISSVQETGTMVLTGANDGTARGGLVMSALGSNARY
ncbi:Serine/threonine-protein kinase 4 [Irineochytrium annulatum]|nr:Serine/threonine-protein kinase 4 [Irineochytrium annulatum]